MPRIAALPARSKAPHADTTSAKAGSTDRSDVGRIAAADTEGQGAPERHTPTHCRDKHPLTDPHPAQPADRRPTRAPDDRPPIVFVHGNGDSAALWQSTLWRYESNGWPRDRLFAIDQPWPLARDDDAVPQAGRSPTAESMAFLESEVDRVLKTTGAGQLVLVGNSRGGNTIRNYVQNGGGDRLVSHVVLGGVPAHGIWAVEGIGEGSEFSGRSPFLRQLNEPKGPNGDEVTPGPRWLTLRSDHNDLYAQPDGRWIGWPGHPTLIGFDGPALKGATNLVLPGADHREVSFSAAAFAASWQFLTGAPPPIAAIAAEAGIVLDGCLTGFDPLELDRNGEPAPTNLPLSGGQLAIYAVDGTTGMRRGGAVHHRVVGADGRWGPFTAARDTPYEFEITAPGCATTHIYRSPFPRSSAIVHLRPERLAPQGGVAGAIVVFSRPRGYFDAQRDTMHFDGNAQLPGVPPQGAGKSRSTLELADGAQRTIAGEFNGQRVTGLVWPADQDHLSVLELTD